MNLTQLRYFGSVARNRSLTKASAELAITQPAISRQMAMLEAEIGAALFIRHHRGVALTKAGELLLSRSEYILRTLIEIQAEVSNFTSEPSGELRIGCPPALSKLLLFSPLQAFLKRYSKVRVQLQERFSDELKDLVIADDLDFAIVSSRMREPNLKAESLFKEQIWLFGPGRKDVAKPSPITPSAIAGLPLLLPRRANTIRTLADRYVADAGRLNIVVESSSNQMIQDLMEAGFGFTVAPYSAHAELFKQKRVWGERIARLSVERFLIRRSDRPVSRAAQEFLRLLRDNLASFKSAQA
ncbi:MAG TPA: LysR family transcriptional regulator [Xanthobacteraceae bacterium]|jgi:LysR family nitrogen assimilation transcriptional regulator|nr:LysR family transcriptional regulator [Xanthobacteraceae bacterium]